MGIERIIRLAIVCGALGLAVPTFAPSFIESVIIARGMDSPLAVPEPAPAPAAKAAPAPAPVRDAYGNGRSAVLQAGQGGHFVANAVINGHSTRIMVDTGATDVALSAETARRLGVMPPQSAFRMPISTANGVTAAAPVTLNEISIGGISLHNVEAVVVPGGALDVDLLGMTFLSRLSKFEIAGSQLTLRQ